MTEFNRIEFIKSQRPNPPLLDWQFWILVVPILASVIGLATLSMYSLAFDNVDIVVDVLKQSQIAVWGSIITIYAAELNSPGTFLQYYRKSFKGEDVTKNDKFAIWLSVIGSVSTALITAALFIMSSSDFFDKDAWWLKYVLTYAPAVAIVSVVCDNVGAMIEAASLVASYEKRIDAWYERLESEQEKLSAEDIHNPLDDIQKQLDNVRKELEKMRRPVATIQDMRKIVAGCNGSRSKLTPDKAGLSELEQLLDENGFNMPTSERTAQGWLEKLAGGKL